jgi:tetratricopeptide (TPR) repeat protein
MSTHPPKSPEVFVSYSHLDDEYKESLVKQLNVLAEQGIISQWHDGLLIAGARWNDEIVKRLNSSRVILLLISVDFLNSVYINDVEIKQASRRYQAGEVTVIPVLLRNVYGWKKKPFGDLKLGDLQALPSNAKFIKGWRDRDDAFADIAEGIQKAVEKLEPVTQRLMAPPPAVPTSHLTDYVKRHDEKGRDILERLKEGLARGKKALFALWGKGGTGKTRIAAEVASALTGEFGQRIVWASAEKRTDFTFATLLDEIARQLGEPDLLKLAPGPKEEAVRDLLAQDPALVVLDNFETIASADERAGCVNFLAERANCPSLITSRFKVASPARNIPIKGMSNQEAQELLDQLIDQTQDSKMFTRQVRNRIVKTAESNPYIMLWMVAQIDEAQTPKTVLDELEQDKGEVAERVFDRSFTLPQVGEDGRAVLLALTLFVPDASHDALAEVAGFDGDLSRLDEAAKNLRMLWLIGASNENERLAVEGLTRSLASARLSNDDRADDFRRRFVNHFLSYAEAHAQPAEDFDALEAEKDNVLSAMDGAFALGDWASVMQLMDAINFDGVIGFLMIRGYWDEAIRRGEQALKAASDLSDEVKIARFSHNLAITYQRQGNLLEAERLYKESLEIAKQLGDEGGIAITLHNLGAIAQNQGEIDQARRLYHESLEIAKKLSDQSGIARTVHQLAKLAQEQGDLVEARRLYQESLEISKKLGNQLYIATSLHNLAAIAQNRGELDKARRLCQESLEINERLGNQSGIAIALYALGSLAQDQGELDQPRRLYHESLEIQKKLGNQSGIAIALHGLGTLAEKQGNNAEAARLFKEALTIFEKLKSPNAETARESLERVKEESSLQGS